VREGKTSTPLKVIQGHLKPLLSQMIKCSGILQKLKGPTRKNKCPSVCSRIVESSVGFFEADKWGIADGNIPIWVHN